VLIISGDTFEHAKVSLYRTLRSKKMYGNLVLVFLLVLIKELKHALSCVLADKAYDSTKNRAHCDEQGIEHHIPVRQWKNARLGYGHKPLIQGKLRRRAKDSLTRTSTSAGH
jgi:hypothetical protein